MDLSSNLPVNLCFICLNTELTICLKITEIRQFFHLPKLLLF